MKPSTEFVDRFGRIQDRISFIDDIDKVLIFPELYRADQQNIFPPMSQLYIQRPSDHPNRTELCEPHIIRLAKKICSFRDNESDIEGAIVAQAVRTTFGSPRNPMPALGRIGENPPEMHAEFRALIYDIVSMLVYQEPIAEIWTSAQQGDTESFLQLARIDKSVVTTDLGTRLVREKQFAADWNFFEKLGKELSKPPMPDSAYKPLAVILTACFWRDEFQTWPHKDLTAFLENQGLLGKTTTGHKSFLRTINKLGLTKDSRGRPKKRT